MSQTEHDWKSMLSNSPHPTRGFSPELAGKIHENIASGMKVRRMRKAFGFGAVVAAIAILLFVWQGSFFTHTHSGGTSSTPKPSEVTWNDHIYMVTSSDPALHIERKLGSATGIDQKQLWDVYKIQQFDATNKIAVQYNDSYLIANASQFLSLKQAQAKVPFTIILPANLPDELHFAHAMVGINPNTNQANEVTMHFESPDQKYVVEVSEQAGHQIGKLGQTAKTLTVNGFPAQYGSNDKIAEMLWTNGSLVFYAYTSPGSELGSVQEMTKLASEFK